MGHDPILCRSEINEWLSLPRYKRYLDIAENNDTLALELYLWNIDLAQCVLRDVSFFEVALRNAYDRAIKSISSSEVHWLFDDNSPVRRPILRTNKRGNLKDANRLNRNAIDRLVSNLGPSPTPDKVISNLTLGFWAHMTDRNHERDLWIPAIHTVWPAETSRDILHRKIFEINNVRNRAAHHEHLFAPKGRTGSTLKACKTAVELFSNLAPKVYQYIFHGDEEGECSVTQFIRDNPAPCRVTI